MGGSFLDLLRQNRNFRLSWFGQIVSEIGDHFNTISVFSLALQNTRSGLVVSGIMLARAVSDDPGRAGRRRDARPLGPQAAHAGERLFRALVATLVPLRDRAGPPWLLYVLSGLLMFASPFFTSGRTAILPTIASPEELHTANSITQTTRYMGVTLGTLLGGIARPGSASKPPF